MDPYDFVPEIVGGPWDGAGVPDDWEAEVICCRTNDVSGTYAIYRRDEDGHYRFERTVDQSELA